MKLLIAVLSLLVFSVVYAQPNNIIDEIFSKKVNVEFLSNNELKSTKGMFVSGFLAAAYYYYNEDEDFSWSKFVEITIYESIYGMIPGEGWQTSGTKLKFKTSGTYTPVIIAKFDTAKFYTPEEYKNFYDRVKAVTGFDYQDLLEIEIYVKPFEPSTISNEIDRDIEGFRNMF